MPEHAPGQPPPMPPGECKPWHRLDRDGYGRIMRQGQDRLAHRWFYEQEHGPIPDGMVVDHMCFNRSCVNPDHLRLLTRPENAAISRRLFAETCTHGHAWTEENTYIQPKTGYRTCRICLSAIQRRNYLNPLLLAMLAGGQEAAHEVEAVAVAIAASDGHDWERLGPGHPLRADYRRNARAARAALLAEQPGGGR